jgi:predicted permease
MGSWLSDIRFALRSLRRSPGFTLAVIGVMGLGIGVNTMIFGITRSLLFRDVPVMKEEGMVRIDLAIPKLNIDDSDLSAFDYEAIRDRTRTMDVSAMWESSAYLTLGEEPERFHSAAVTPGTFRLLGVAPALGREFTPEEGVYDQNWTSVIISERIWRERFRRDPSVLGRTYNINGRRRSIVGVMPANFRYPELADFWIPAAWKAEEESWHGQYLGVVGRLKPGVTLAAANAELTALSQQLGKEQPDARGETRLVASDYRERLGRDIRPMMMLMLAAVGFVLLVACANVANLMLARSATRQRELSLRMAVGATRFDVARLLLIEGVIVTLAGGVLGLVLAIWGRDLVLATIPEEFPYWMDFSMDFQGLAFTFALSALAGILASLAPAFHVSDLRVMESLKDGGAATTASGGRLRLRRALVVAEVALALVLLAGAGLMVRSFLNMSDQRKNLQAEGLLTGTVTLPVAVYKGEAGYRAFFQEFLPAAAQLPGVEAVSAVNELPLGGSSWSNIVMTEENVDKKNIELPHIYWGVVAPGYFSTIGIRVVEGRDFELADDDKSRRVAIVNRSAAKMLWPAKNAIGQRFKFGTTDTTGWAEVVGIVDDVDQNPTNHRPTKAQVFTTHAQSPTQTMTVLLRTSGDPTSLTTPVRKLLQARDANLPFYDVMTMTRALDFGLWESRLFASLMASFSAIALLIAAIGLYGVMAYNVAQRTQEIGIRMALGAAAADVQRMIVGQALRITMLGIGIGLAGAFAVTRLMAGMLYGVQPGDPPTFVLVTVLLALSGVLAAWVPARRATLVEPVRALRYE